MQHLDQDAIANFVRGPRASEGATEVRRHLASCPECRAKVQAYNQGTLQAMATAPLGADEPHDPTWPNRDAVRQEEPGNLARGERLGRYLVVDLLGEGGMGVVYAAYDPELDRKVAVKLLSADAEADAGDGAGDGKARLLREAQAMARVSHPNVIAVHDVGTWGDRVFVAMEIVEGGTLKDWVERAPRTWREVVEVFLQSGRGLAAAHHTGMVHRDFKPENVLVGKDGRPRVTDFGLARLVSSGTEERRPSGPKPSLRKSQSRLNAQVTQMGVVMGTPAYMSPEHQLGLDLDARSDQFSFCAALYWALYRKRPFDPDQLAAAAVRSAGEEEHSGTRSDRATGTRAATALGRGAIQEPPKDAKVPSFVRRAVLRGLAISPDDRFATMEALLAELSRDPSVKRRRAALGAGLAVAVAAGAFTYHRSSVEQTQLCRGAERKLAGVWDPASQAALEQAFAATGRPYAKEAAQRVSQVLDQYARDWAAMHQDACEATRLRGEQTEQVLSLRMICLDSRLQEMRALSNLVTHADGAVVDKAVDAAHALSSLRGCADVAALTSRTSLPDDPAVRARIDAAGAVVAQAKTLHDAGRYKDALEAARRAAEEAKQIGYRPLLAKALDWRGWLEDKTGDPQAAVKDLTQAVFDAEAGRDDEEKTRDAIRLVWVHGYSQRHQDLADLWAASAGSTLTRTGGNEELAFDLENTLANLQLQVGNKDEARKHLNRALELADRVLSAEDPKKAKLRVSLGVLERQQGNTDKALAELQRALQDIERIQGPEHPYAAYPHNTLASVYRERGELDKALDHMLKALGIWKAALGPDNPTVGDGDDHLATILQESGNYGEALAAAQEAVAIKEKALGADHPTLAYSLENEGNAYLSLRKPKEAVAPLERAIRLREAAKDPPADLADARFSLAKTLVALNKDRGRARALALRARSDFGEAKDAKKEAEVASWMAANKVR